MNTINAQILGTVGNTVPLRIRAVSWFHSEELNFETLEEQLKPAVETLRNISNKLESGTGYQVQTNRVVTRFFDHCFQQVSVSQDVILSNAKKLESVLLSMGVTFISLGCIRRGHFIEFPWLFESNFISDLAVNLTHTSFSVEWPYPNTRTDETDNIPFSYDSTLIARNLSRQIMRMAEVTDGDANFRFCISYSTHSLVIPYFPAASAPDHDKNGFAIGLESDSAMHRIIKKVRETAWSANNITRGGLGMGEDVLLVDAIRNNYEKYLYPIQMECERVVKESGHNFIYHGIDTSICPSLDGPSLTEIVRIWNKDAFGASGTLHTIKTITKALKSMFGIKTTGFCGLMLPVAEDSGLGKAVEAVGPSFLPHIDIQRLLFYSSVCGVGLDTIPVPGTSNEMSQLEKYDLEFSMANILLDVASLSHQLNGKPLTARLLPIPGAKPGQLANFKSPFLINTHVMKM